MIRDLGSIAVDDCPLEPGLSVDRGCAAPQALRVREASLAIEQRIAFSSGTSRLSAEALATVAEIAQWLALNADVCVQVVGSAEAAGGEASRARTLAAERAARVVAALVAEGIAPARLEPRSRSAVGSPAGSAPREVEFVTVPCGPRGRRPTSNVQ